jgi:gamma-glutamyltranspeptidase / glutathione hydrolase
VICRKISGWLLIVLSAPLSAADQPGHAAIASAHTLATQAGFEVLAAGGNAFDAAVAVASTLSVVEPQSSGLGGGGFFLVRRMSDGKETMIDARETAPAAVDQKDYLKANGEPDRDHSLNGPLSSGIPGEPAALVWMAKNYGRLPLEKSLAPAIRIAREGFKPDSRFIDELAYVSSRMANYPASVALYLVDGKPPQVGWTFRSPDLANVLEKIAHDGDAAFYRGDVAKTLVDGVHAAGGRWSMDDLAKYTVKERDPIAFSYRGWHIVTAPPPSSGGIALAEMLNMLGGFDLQKMDRVHRVHTIVETMRRAYRDRAEYLGDPDYVKMPVAELTSPLYAAGLRASIHPDKATPSDMLPGYMSPDESLHTSHFSIIDAEGNLVSATQTVNTTFGSKFVVAGTGFVLNNEMDDFALVAGKPNAYGLLGNDNNAPKPGSRPLSSMTPTFIDGHDKTAVIGTPGGSSIITMVLEGILAFVDGDLPEKIVAERRYHHQYMPDQISAEKDAFSDSEIQALQQMGYKLNIAPDVWSWGFVNMVSWNRATGQMHAASDPRRPSGSGMVK